MSVYDDCKRMTTTNQSGKAILKHPIICRDCNAIENTPYDENGYNIANWIAVLEDLLFDKDGNALVKYSRLAELAAAEREGCVVVLPCEMQGLKDAISEISYSEGCLLDVLDLAKYGNCKMDCFECLTNAIAEAALAGKGE